jgi:hypothetical protein
MSLMMMTNHPITPPPELVQQWYQEADSQLRPYYVYIAIRAAQWGADQELEACCEWLKKNTDYHITIEFLRAARRPKPPSLAKRALHILGTHGDLSCAEHDTIRCALEALPE